MPKMIVCKGDCGYGMTDVGEAEKSGWRTVTSTGQYMCPDCMSNIVYTKLMMDDVNELTNKMKLIEV